MNIDNYDALCIIDMQPDFAPARNHFTITQICNLVKQFIAANKPIIIAEYSTSGRTVISIMDLVRNYENCYYVVKYEDDGSDKIDEALSDNFDEINNLLLCGVNSGYCVASTAIGLSNRYQYNVEIVRDACNCWTQDDPFRWYIPEKYPRLQLV